MYNLKNISENSTKSPKGYELKMVPTVVGVMLLSCTCVLTTNSSEHAQSSRSSVLQLIENSVLIGHDLRRQHTYDLLECAQQCLAVPGCVSFNYENVGGGECVLKSRGVDTAVNNGEIGQRLTQQPGYVFGQLLNISDEATYPAKPTGNLEFTFTALGAHGSTGPTDTAGYVGTALEGTVTLESGIQLWTIPRTGRYVIQAFGASGSSGNCSEQNCSGSNQGGLGARLAGTFDLEKGDKLRILVGQKGGEAKTTFAKMPGGGGGGTFVTLFDQSPLIIAGGGGGGGITLPGYGQGDPGQAGTNGTRHGGSEGSGGKLYNQKRGDASKILAGSGAGLNSDGAKPSMGLNSAAKSFKNGGKGGSSMGAEIAGGFGGGGFAWTHPGGGGGYSGGGVTGSQISGFAGGGGSYNGGSNQKNEKGVNKGDGRVVIHMN